MSMPSHAVSRSEKLCGVFLWILQRGHSCVARCLLFLVKEAIIECAWGKSFASDKNKGEMKRSNLQLEADAADRVCIALSRLVHAKSEADRQRANKWVLVWEIYYAKISGISFNSLQPKSASRNFDEQEGTKSAEADSSLLHRAAKRCQRFYRAFRWIVQREHPHATGSQLNFDFSVSATR